MKKLLLTVAFAFTFVALQAQDLSFGVKLGANFASIGGDETGDLDGRTAFHLGGVVNYALSDAFSLQGELLYSGVGAKAEFSESFEGENFSEEVTTKLNYLSIPLMGSYNLSDSFSLQAGPQISLLLSAEADFSFTDTFDGETDSESGTEDLKNETSGLDLGFAVGGTYELDMGVFFSARYVLGLSNINDFEGSDNFKNQNNVLQISAGYKFN